MKKPELDDQDKSLNRTGYIHVAFSVGSKEKVDQLKSFFMCSRNLSAIGVKA